MNDSNIYLCCNLTGVLRSLKFTANILHTGLQIITNTYTTKIVFNNSFKLILQLNMLKYDVIALLLYLLWLYKMFVIKYIFLSKVTNLLI